VKLSPLETAFEKAAERILRKHKKDLEAYVTLLYTRAVGQAVEFLEAKTSPAKKANATRKREGLLRNELSYIAATLKIISLNKDADLQADLEKLIHKAETILKVTEKGGEA
jgi:hypothetical protein